jgi:hypothetical protein
LRKIPVERRKSSRAEWRGKFSLKTGFLLHHYHDQKKLYRCNIMAISFLIIYIYIYIFIILAYTMDVEALRLLHADAALLY